MSEQPDQFLLDACKSTGKNPADVKCWHCLDGEFYPQYGRAPHGLFFVDGPSVTNDLPQDQWPSYFRPDWDDLTEDERATYKGPMCGTWYCPKDCEMGGISHAL